MSLERAMGVMLYGLVMVFIGFGITLNVMDENLLTCVMIGIVFGMMIMLPFLVVREGAE